MEMFEWILLLTVLLTGVLFLSQTSATCNVYCKMVLFYGWTAVMSTTVPLMTMLIWGRRVENTKFLCFVMRPVKYFLGFKITVQGSEILNTKGPYMVVVNHQSILDILGIAEVLPDHCVILCKKEIKYIVPIGFSCWLCKFFFIDRSNHHAARETMDHIAQTLLQENLRIWVYPEGTRNRIATIRPFRRGVFNMAVKAQIPIIPVVTSYYQQHPNCKKPLFCRDKWIIQILPKIETQGLGPEDVPALADSTHKLMLDTFNEINQHIPHFSDHKTHFFSDKSGEKKSPHRMVQISSKPGTAPTASASYATISGPQTSSDASLDLPVTHPSLATDPSPQANSTASIDLTTTCPNLTTAHS